MRRLLGGLLGIIVAASCSGPGQPARPPPPTHTSTPPPTQPSYRLTRFADCAQVLTYLRQSAMPRVGREGLAGGFPIVPVESPTPDNIFGEVPRTSDVFPTPPRPLTPPTGEPDVIQAGDRLFKVIEADGLHGGLGALRNTSSGIQPAGYVELPIGTSLNSGVLIHGDRAFVVTNVSFKTGDAPDANLPGADIEGLRLPHVIVTVVDIRNVSSMKVLYAIHIDGSYVSARIVRSSLRLVTRSTGNLKLVAARTVASASAISTVIEQDKRTVASSELSQWLPSFMVTDAKGAVTRKGTLSACGDTYRASSFSGFPVTTVTSVDGYRPDARAVGAIVGDAGIVQASDRSIYVVVEPWLANDPPPSGATNRVVSSAGRTEIHRFDISPTTGFRYVAMGALSEAPLDLADAMALRDDGDLVLATVDVGTKGVIRDRAYGGLPSSATHIHVLRTQGSILADVGKASDIGGGSPVWGVQFTGEFALVRSDPCTVVSIHDPAQPVVGTFPRTVGCATPYDLGDHLVLVFTADPHPTDRTTVSLVDIAQPAQPRVVATKHIAQLQQATDGPLSSHWFADRKLFVTAFYGPLDRWEKAYAVITMHVDRDSGITEVARKLDKSHDLESQDPVYPFWFRIGTVGQVLYAATPSGVLTIGPRP